MPRRALIMIICSLLILLFIYVAITKLLDYGAFRFGLSKIPGIGRIDIIVSLALLISLVWISVLLCIPSMRLWGLCGSAILMLIVTLYLSYVLYFTSWQHHFFGKITRPYLSVLNLKWNQLLVFDVCFLMLSITGVLLQRKLTITRQERELPPVIFT